MDKFISTRNKIVKIQKELINQENDITKLPKFSYKKNTSSFLKKINIVEIDTTPVYYDLYNFKGITYSTGTISPEPESAYEKSDEPVSGDIYTYTFIYPIYGFSVLSGETPESVTGGATPWEFKTTVAVIKNKIHLPNMPDWAITGCKLISYLYNEDGSLVENLKIVLLEEGQNLDEISVDFSEFYRWVKLEEGYNFEQYVIYPIPENHQISLKSNLYIYNFKNNYYGQSGQIQFK